MIYVEGFPKRKVLLPWVTRMLPVTITVDGVTFVDVPPGTYLYVNGTDVRFKKGARVYRMTASEITRLTPSGRRG